MAIADIIIVLGGGISREGILPPWVLPRLDKALELYHENVAPVILLSGKGRDNFPVPEAEAMRDYLKDRGMDPRRLLLECLSADTLQNAFFSRVIHLDPLHLGSAVVITNEFHMQRTQQIFNFVMRADFEVSYQAVSDHNLNKRDLELRAFTETHLREFYQRLFASLQQGELMGLHRFIYDLENPFYQEYRQLGKILEDKMTLY